MLTTVLVCSSQMISTSDKMFGMNGTEGEGTFDAAPPMRSPWDVNWTNSFGFSWPPF